MSFARTSACIGLAGLGLWLLTATPVRASEVTGLYARGPGLTGLHARGPGLTGLHAPGLTGEQSNPLHAGGSMGTGSIGADCTFRGKLLAGKVKVVDSFPDIRVKAVRSFPDLKVKRVTSFADSCGEWQFVDSFPDLKIQYVDSFPDIEIAWVDSFPGMP